MAKRDTGTEERGAAAGIGRNFIAMLVLQLGAYVMSFATFPYLARVLGPHEFGVFGFATAAATYGTTLTEWGFNLSGPKAVVENRTNQDALNELIWSIIGGKAILCVTSLVILIIALQFNTQLAADFKVVLCSWLAVVANVFTMYWLMQGLERFKTLAIVVLIARATMLPLTFIFVKGPGDVVAAAMLQAGGPLAAALLSLLVAFETGVLRRPAVSPRAIWRRLRQGADMFVATAAVNLFSSANIVILGTTAGAYAVGVYSAADKIRNVGNIIPAQINQVFFPRISALFKARRNEAARLTVLGVGAVQLSTIVVVAGFFCGSSNISNFVLGAKYDGSAEILKLLALCALVGNLSYFVGLQILVPFGGARKRSLIMLIGGIVNVVAVILASPRFGAKGAAVSLLISEAIVLLLYGILIISDRELRRYCISGCAPLKRWICS